MSDGQWDIAGYVFGTGTPWGVASFDPGARVQYVNDTPRASGHGRAMGRDREDGPEWVWLLRLRDTTPEEVLARLGELRAAWQGPEAPHDLLVLSYDSDGRRRRVYGRPRGFRPITNPVHRAAGYAEAEVTFQLADPLQLDEAPGMVPLRIVPASSSGLVFPTAPPFRWSASGEPVSRVAAVDGDAPTPVSVRFVGPVDRPWVRVGETLIALRGSLAYDESVTVDARTLTVTRQDGAAVPGMLAPRTRLNELRLPPGDHLVTFGGTDLTGTARAEVSWRNAWRTL